MVTLRLEKYKERLDVSYVLAGIEADVGQLLRAYLRGDTKGKKKNVTQIIKKLDKIHKKL